MALVPQQAELGLNCDNHDLASWDHGLCVLCGVVDGGLPERGQGRPAMRPQGTPGPRPPAQKRGAPPHMAAPVGRLGDAGGGTQCVHRVTLAGPHVRLN